MAVNFYFQSGVPGANFGEQNLLEGMIIETIQISGFEVYYLPRATKDYDELMGEDRSSYFENVHMIEMYLENVDGFGGDGELLSKFGIEIRETATFTVARRRWEELIAGDPALTVPHRPNEGDLIYLPLTKSFLEIKSVTHANPFYQLGKLYTYKLNCELYQYSHEVFNTGIPEIDSLNRRSEDEMEFAIATEDGKDIITEEGELLVSDTFNISEIDYNSDNQMLLSETKKILDFSEDNPFGEYI